jgi:predicted O-linked N-acetylglucosamine transferase (SPINDLY family)
MKPTQLKKQKEQVVYLFSKGLELHQQNKYQEAKVLYEQILKIQPNHFDSYALLGLISGQTNQFTQAVDFLSKALQIKPYHAETCFNLGLALKQLKRFDESLASYEQAIKIKPDYAEAYSTRGNVLQEIKRFDEAIASYDHAISIKPEYPEALYNRGIVLKELRRFDEALLSYKQAIYIRPNFAEALNNQGLVLHELRRFDEALSSYKRAIDISPYYPEAYLNFGNALLELKRYEDAIVSYKKAILIKPDYVEAFSNCGIALIELKRYDEAIVSYNIAICIKPDFIDAHFNLGNALIKFKRYDEALKSYRKVLEVKLDYKFLFGLLQHIEMVMCSWENFDNQKKLILQKTHTKEKASDPFTIITITDALSTQRVSSEIWVQERYPSNTSLGPIYKNPKKKKIILGYYSADFRNHAIASLIAELFELHNQEMFELIAFIFGPEVNDEMYNRLSKSFNQFIDVRNKTDEEIAALSRQLGIDIAIDLGGLTGDCRPGIFSFRAAPVQVSYLGYPGTMGASYIDYIVADHTLIPTKSKEFYSEKIIFLPNSYQVNDRKKVMSDKKFSRAELGLPEYSFVYCCFNNNHKILPTTFLGWMRILKAVKDSVLLFLEDNSWSAANLKSEAEKQGVEPSRLIFVKRMLLPEHLARHRQADLFLDTFPYNAHTTASDALWAGLPVLTIMGESFASRVAASLLNAIELPELITSTQEHYEALAIELATNPAKLKAIKTKLEANRLTTPLFDTPRFTKHLEEAYAKMYERYHADLPAEHIYIEDEYKSH